MFLRDLSKTVFKIFPFPLGKKLEEGVISNPPPLPKEKAVEIFLLVNIVNQFPKLAQKTEPTCVTSHHSELINVPVLEVGLVQDGHLQIHLKLTLRIFL